MIGIQPQPAFDANAQQDGNCFLRLLPGILRVARFAFRYQPRCRRRELVDDVVANCYVAFVRLVATGKADRAFATALAHYGVRQVVAGRRVGTKVNVRDALSDMARRRRAIKVVALHDDRCGNSEFGEIVLADRRSSPAELACFRIDFVEWLSRLRPRLRAIALTLAAGFTPLEVARHLRLSKPRISQFRQQLRLSWEAFQGQAAA